MFENRLTESIQTFLDDSVSYKCLIINFCASYSQRNIWMRKKWKIGWLRKISIVPFPNVSLPTTPFSILFQLLLSSPQPTSIVDPILPLPPIDRSKLLSHHIRYAWMFRFLGKFRFFPFRGIKVLIILLLNVPIYALDFSFWMDKFQFLLFVLECSFALECHLLLRGIKVSSYQVIFLLLVISCLNTYIHICSYLLCGCLNTYMHWIFYQ